MEPIPPTPWLEHLARHLPLAREGVDPEGVHQLRVAAGRLGVWLELAGRRVLRDDLRWLRGSAGRVRELDVLLGEDLPEDFRAWLAERRQGERARMLEALEAPRLAGLLAGFSVLPALEPRKARARRDRLERRAAKRGRRLEEHPADVARCHALRKALRRVRYAMEWCGEDTRPVRAMQSSLGDLNDAAVALELLAEFPGGAAHTELRARLEETVDAERRRSLKRWRASALRAEEAER